ncbi:MAG: class I SAM-dependent methyltransferase [Chromatiaceae bacterium]|jgi:ubiquinone/menaquinone biosynthesis C-methylase UbiE
MSVSRPIRHNIAVHDRLASHYDALHGDIFNSIEQERLRCALTIATDAIRSDGEPVRALDFGCGSGNLTHHFLELGLHTVSADVAPRFLELIKARPGATGLSETLRLNGEDLSNIADETFDVAAAYSVLHHIPDYLTAVRELIRVTKRGGVVFIDHEHNADYWSRSADYREFVRLAKQQRANAGTTRPPWLKRKVRRLRRLINPRYMPEGDIHVWPDDHIEWERIEEVFADADCETVYCDDYLNYASHCPQELHERYRHRCTDMRVMAVRRC